MNWSGTSMEIRVKEYFLLFAAIPGIGGHCMVFIYLMYYLCHALFIYKASFFIHLFNGSPLSNFPKSEIKIKVKNNI